MMKKLRLELPEDAWSTLDGAAKSLGVSIGVYARDMLTEHASTVFLPPPVHQVTPDEWRVVVDWVKSHPLAWASYTGDSKPQDNKGRLAVMVWVESVRGYADPPHGDSEQDPEPDPCDETDGCSGGKHGPECVSGAIDPGAI